MCSYWEDIMEVIFQIMGERVRKNPWTCLFNDTEKEAPQ